MSASGWYKDARFIAVALRELPEPRCPECGTPFDRVLLKELQGNRE